MNQFVCASLLGYISDYEGVRLYTDKGKLIARILVDNGLATKATSYLTAINAAVPAVESLIPSDASTLRTALAAPSFHPSIAPTFISSSLDLGSEYLVVVFLDSEWSTEVHS